MACDNDDIVYISDLNSSAVLMHSTTTRQYIGQLLNNIRNPAGIAVDMEKYLLYVCYHAQNSNDLFGQNNTLFG